VASTKGDIIEQGQKKVIKNKGMPFFKDPFYFGNLIVIFNVIFPLPHELNEEHIDKLKEILGDKQKESKVTDSRHEYFMDNFNEDQINDNEEGGKKPADEREEDEAFGGRGVRCAQQ